MTDLVTLISTVGFPIALCIWFMTKTEKVINNNTKAMIEVKTTMEYCKNKNG